MAQDRGLFIGWKHMRPGREALADQNFKDTAAFCEKQKKAGNVTSYEWVTLTPHGGSIGGFLLVRGEHKNLEAFAWDPEFLGIISRGEHSAEGIMVIWALVGDEARDMIAAHHALGVKL